MNIKMKQLVATMIAIGLCAVVMTAKAVTPPALPTLIVWDGQYFNGQQYTLPASQTTTVTGVSWGTGQYAATSIQAQISLTFNGSGQVMFAQVASKNCSGGLWFANAANTPPASAQPYFACDTSGVCAPFLLPPTTGTNPVCKFTIQNTSASNTVTVTLSNSLDKSRVMQNPSK